MTSPLPAAAGAPRWRTSTLQQLSESNGPLRRHALPFAHAYRRCLEDDMRSCVIEAERLETNPPRIESQHRLALCAMSILAVEPPLRRPAHLVRFA